METRPIHTGTFGIAPAEGGMFLLKALSDENLKTMAITHLPLGLTLIMPVGYRPEFSNSNTLNRDLKVQSAAAPTQTMMGKNIYEDLHVSVLNMGTNHAVKRGDVIAYLYVQKTTKLPPTENLANISVVGDIRTVPSNVISYLMTMCNADFDGMITTYFTESTSSDDLDKYKKIAANLACKQLYDAASAAVKNTIDCDFQNKKKFSMQPRVVNTTSIPIDTHVHPKKDKTPKTPDTDTDDDIDADTTVDTHVHPKKDKTPKTPDTDDEIDADTTVDTPAPKPMPTYTDLMSSDDDEGKPVPRKTKASAASKFSDDDNVDVKVDMMIAAASDDEPLVKLTKALNKLAAIKPKGKSAPVGVDSDGESDPEPIKLKCKTSKPAAKHAPVDDSDSDDKPSPKHAPVDDSDDEPSPKHAAKLAAKPTAKLVVKPAPKSTKPAPKSTKTASDSSDGDKPAPKPTKPAPKPPGSDSDSDDEPPKPTSKPTSKPPVSDSDSDDKPPKVVQTPAALAAMNRAKSATLKAEKIANDKAAELAAAAAEFTSSDTELAAVDAKSSDDDSDDSDGPGTRKPAAKPAAKPVVAPRSKGPSRAFTRK